MDKFLAATAIIDFRNPEVTALARAVAQGASSKQEIIGRCYTWVRDEVRHSADYQIDVVTCTASEVLKERTGLCYAKSHLLAGLLRANGIPAGFCYQRLKADGGAPRSYCLHGLNAVWLETKQWYRLDPRGNRADVDAQFTPPVERLAYCPNLAEGEYDLPTIFEEPLDIVVNVLRSTSSCAELWERLPDAPFSCA